MRDKKRDEYETDPEPQKAKMRENYQEEKNNITSLKSLKNFQERSLHGPIFLCLFCAEYNFRSNVKRENLDEDKEEQ